MKIILIAPAYFNYHQIIVAALTDLGHQVDFIEDKNSGFIYSLSQRNSFLKQFYRKHHENKCLKKLSNGSYDQMIVIGGKLFSSEFWAKINQKFAFKKVLYQWDSLNNFDYRSMIASFDVTMTFDSQDAKKVAIPYLPLFYKNTNHSDVALDIDLLFVGIWHSDRIEVLNQIIVLAKKYHLNHFIKLYYPKYLYLYLVHFKKYFPKSDLFIHKPINATEMNSLYQRAKCVIDINHPDQSGLTMRTIETIGAGKKLITTNSFVNKEDFYNNKMIQIIDRKNIQIEEAFFQNFAAYHNIEKLEINNWILELL